MLGARLHTARLRINRRLAHWVGGCVLCGAPTTAFASSSSKTAFTPRLCAHCIDELLHPCNGEPTALTKFYRCTQCAHLLTTPDPLCLSCLSKPFSFTSTVAFADYAQAVQQMLLRYKFHQALHFAPVLADCLTTAFNHYAAMHTPDVVCLVPQLPERLRQRGFDPLRLLMQQIDWARLVWSTPPTYAPDALLRLRHEELQIHLKHDERRKQVKNAFALNPDFDCTDRHILLIDDIITTGATLDEIARLLLRHGARRVDNLVLARTPKSPMK